MKDKVLNSTLNLKRKVKFLFFVTVAILVTVAFAKYVSNLLFDGKNSLKVYTTLQQKKQQLENSIHYLQLDNARLQKEYFELKNLEPEE